MNEQVNFVVKVILLSALLSIVVKYGGQKVGFGIAPTKAIALVIVILPTIVVALALWWQTKSIE